MPRAGGIELELNTTATETRGVVRAARAGWIALAVLVILGAWWTHSWRVEKGTAVSARAVATPGASTLAGWRSDAWYLADEPLLGFVEVPAGPFAMGSDPAVDRQAFENERWSTASVQGHPDLPAFLISRDEVTVQQFKAFADATNHRVDPGAFNAPPTHPVTLVSWPDALAYCRWLDTQMRASQSTPPALKERLSQGWKIDLPTEAQWEKAARGTDGRIFPWGNEPSTEFANFRGTATSPVGSFKCPACPFGLADMSGNVWEWTRSPYQPYPYDSGAENQNLRADALWVMRGGSFADGDQNVRAAIRGGADPGARRPFIGFRVVLAPR